MRDGPQGKKNNEEVEEGGKEKDTCAPQSRGKVGVAQDKARGQESQTRNEAKGAQAQDGNSCSSDGSARTRCGDLRDIDPGFVVPGDFFR